ncbi:MAG: hypothetical protein JWM99_4069 [Verrucomicrobiales bacterium]|nr:hypothetical protein [Verrucomicrobiales bacterium]
MAWIKKNLFLLIGGLVALALLGLAGFYLYQGIQADASVTEELDQRTATLKQLVNQPVHPGTDKVNNIALAKDDEKRLNDFMAQIRKQFAPPIVEKELNNQSFRGLLDTTVANLQQLAGRSGMNLPVKDYWFTYGAQKSAVDFKDVGSLASELADVRALVEILCEAKVPALVGLKRVPTTGESGYVDFLSSGKSVTNSWAAVTPYEVTFQGFSSELARVMEGLVTAPQCFVVKTLGVDKAPAAAGVAVAVAPTPAELQSRMMQSRYGGMGGGMSRYNRLPPPAPVAAAPQAPVSKGGLVTVLDENKLRFTLALEVVKLLPPSK